MEIQIKIMAEQNIQAIIDKGIRLSPEESDKISAAPTTDVRDPSKVEEGGFVKGVVRGVVSPFQKAAFTTASAGKGLFQLGQAGIQALLGDKDKAIQTAIKAGKPVKADLGYFGRGRPLQSTQEAIGAGIQIGLTAAGPLSKMPTSILGKSISPVIGKGLEYAGLGAGFSFGKAMEEEEKDPIKIARQTFVGGLVSGLTGASLKGTGELLRKYKVAERLYDSALRVSKKLKIAGRSPSKALSQKRGMWGSLGKIRGRVEMGIMKDNEKIDDLLRYSKTTVRSKDVLNDALIRLKNKFGSTHSTAELRAALQKVNLHRLRVKKYPTLNDLNAVRKQLDRQLGDTVWLSQKVSPINKEAMKSAANALRNTIQSKLPSTKPVFKNMSTYINTKDLIDDVLARSGNRIFSFGDLVMAGLGAGAGATVGATGSLSGAIGLVATRRIIESPFVKTAIARLIEKGAEQGATNLGKSALLNIIKEAQRELSEKNIGESKKID